MEDSSEMYESSKVSVGVRIRPLVCGSYINAEAEVGVSKITNSENDISSVKNDKKNHQESIRIKGKGKDAITITSFDRVFDQGATQDDVFHFVRPLIENVGKGINGTIFAYGQTGSGKTHTIFGSKPNL